MKKITIKASDDLCIKTIKIFTDDFQLMAWLHGDVWCAALSPCVQVENMVAPDEEKPVEVHQGKTMDAAIEKAIEAWEDEK